MSRDHTQSKRSEKILSRVHCCQREFDPTAGCSSNTADGPARKVHEQNFGKVAAARIASTKQQTTQEIIEEYRDVFEGDLGTLEGLQHLDIDPSMPPTVAPSQRVPFAIRPKLKTELDSSSSRSLF